MKYKQYRNVIIQMFITSFLYIVFSNPVYKTRFAFREQNSITNSSLFIGLVSVSKAKIRREKTFYSWIKNLNGFENIEVAFITEAPKKPDSFTGIKYIPPVNYSFSENCTRKCPQDKNRAAKRIASVEYFLKHTNYDWMLSATDDIFLDVYSIQDILAHFSKSFNPRKDIMFKGHCICPNWIKQYYLQGGVGYFFSRAAAQLFYDKYSKIWFEKVHLDDDYHSSDIRKFFGLPIADTSTNFMYGFSFGNGIKPNFYKRLKKCPMVLPKSKCQYSLYPLSQLHMLHLGVKEDPEEAFNIIHHAETIHNNIYYYYDYLYLQFCFGKPYK